MESPGVPVRLAVAVGVAKGVLVAGRVAVTKPRVGVGAAGAESEISQALRAAAARMTMKYLRCMAFILKQVARPRPSPFRYGEYQSRLGRNNRDGGPRCASGVKKRQVRRALSPPHLPSI